MSTLNVIIDNAAGGSGAAAPKLTAYVMHGLGLALSYIYNAYLCIPMSINYSSLLPTDVANTLLVNHVKSASVITK